MAGFEIEDNRAADQKGWILYPVIYKLFNSRNEGGYTSGITPDIEVNDLKICGFCH